MVFVLPTKLQEAGPKWLLELIRESFPHTATHTKTNRGLGWQNQLFPKVKQEGQSSSSSGGLREKDKSFLIIFVSTSQIRSRSGRESVEKCSPTPSLSLSLHTWVRISHTTFMVAHTCVEYFFVTFLAFFFVCAIFPIPLWVCCAKDSRFSLSVVFALPFFYSMV